MQHHVPTSEPAPRPRLTQARAGAVLAAALCQAVPATADSFGDLIEIAETAAPAAISQDAAIYYLDPDGVILRVREGHNGWWCMAPSQALLGPRVPLCGDAVAFDWLMAWLDHEEPTPGAIGIIYALAGGRDASAVNPYRFEPSGRTPWLVSGPHVMVVNPPEEVLALYPARPTPDISAPYVMWAETSLAHLRVPVD